MLMLQFVTRSLAMPQCWPQLMCELGYETNAQKWNAPKVDFVESCLQDLFAVMGDCVCGMIGTLAYPSYEHDDPSGEFLPWSALSGRAPPRNGRALIATAETDLAQRGICALAWIHGLPGKKKCSKFYSRSVTSETVWRFVKQLPVSK